MIKNQNPTKKIVVVIGPTATNKTKVGITIAQKINGEIINADAFQVYRELNIGVNKPTNDEMQQAKFHLISNVSIHDKWDIKRFQDEANLIIQDIYAQGKIPILVGGSHLYVDALINNYDLTESLERDSTFSKLTTEALSEQLKKYDTNLAHKIGNNHKRLVRALQITSKGKTMHKVNAPIYTPIYVFCNKSREQLYLDINHRVDQMMRTGWIEEVRELINQTPCYKKLNAFKAIGYLTIANGLTEPTLGIDINKIKQQTRQYAKRQLTWIHHHYQNVFEYKQNNLKDVLHYVIKQLGNH